MKASINYNTSILVFFTLVLLLCLPLKIYPQSTSLCNGKSSDTLIIKTFGNEPSSTIYSTRDPEFFGFSTTFKPRSEYPQNPKVTNDGYYSIVNQIPNDFNVWVTGNDHTIDPAGSRGFMLLVNGDANRGEFYRDTVDNLCIGATYTFSAWIANVFRRDQNQQIPPKAMFQIRDFNGNILNFDTTGAIPLSGTNNSLSWIQKGITFKAPATSVILVMISTALSGKGNDLVIDDIGFTSCKPAVIGAGISSVCEGSNVTFTDSISGNSDYKFSQWQIKVKGASAWSYIGSVAEYTGPAADYSVKLNLPNVTFSDDSTQYRLILGTSAVNLSNPASKCNAISPTSTLRVTKYPILTTNDPAITCVSSFDLTQASITAGSTLNNSTLSYFSNATDANSNKNALSIANAKAVNTSSTYYIKATTIAAPGCTAIKPVKITFESKKSIKLSAPTTICRDLPTFTVSATIANINTLDWKINSNPTPVQSGSNTSYLVTPTADELKRDSVWLKVQSTDAVVACPNVKDSIKINFFNPATITLPKDTLFCSTNNPLSLLVTAKSSNNTSNITWLATGAVATPTSGNNTTLNLTGVSNKVTLIASVSTTGCNPRKDTMLIIFVAKPTVTFNTLNAICNTQDSIVVSASNLTNATTLLWKGGNGTYKKNNENPTVYYPSSSEKSNAGNVLLRVLAKGNLICPADSSSTSLNISKLATVTISPLSSICATTDNIQLVSNVQNQVSLSWSGGTGSFTNQNSNNTTYNLNSTEKSLSNINLRLTAISASPCPAVVQNTTLTILQPPTVSINALNDICETQQTINLNAITNFADSIKWTPKSGLFSNIKSTTSQYTFSSFDLLDSTSTFIIDAFGPIICSVAKDTAIIKIKKKPFISLNPIATNCSTFDSVIISFLSNNYKNINWNIGAGNLIESSNNKVIYFPTANEKLQDSIHVTAIAESVGLCPNSQADSRINIVQFPTVSINPVSIICETDTAVNIKANISKAQKVDWISSTNGIFDIIDSSFVTYRPTLNDIQNMESTVFIKVQGFAPCGLVADTVSFELKPKPEISIKNLDKICLDSNTIKLVVINKNVQTITWSSGGNGTFTNTNKDTVLYRFSNNELASGKTKFFVSGTAFAPCKDLVDSVNSNFVLPPIISINKIQPICADEKSINVSGNTQNTSSNLWTGGDGSFLDKNATSTSYTLSTKDLQGSSIKFTLIAIGNTPCLNKSLSTNLIINPLPSASANKIAFCNDDNATITIDAGMANKYLWTNLTDTTRFVTVNNYDVYSVLVKDINGCKATRTIETYPECMPRLFISNAFSPNNDGTNDLYNVYGAHIAKFEMLIFNRWGEIIFRTNDWTKAWDGNYLNDPMPIGVYEWMITYEGDSEKYKGPYTKKGSVTVIR